MVAFLLFLILLVLLFGASRVLSVGIVIGVVIIAIVLALIVGGLGLAFFLGALDWLRTSWREIPAIAAGIVLIAGIGLCFVAAGAGLASAISQESEPDARMIGLVMAGVSLASLESAYSVSVWAWFFVIAPSLLSVFCLPHLLKYVWYLPRLRMLPQPQDRVARVQRVLLCVALAATVAAAYGGYIGAQWLRWLGYLPPGLMAA